MESLDTLSGQVIGAAIDIHRALGPGLLESVYEELLCLELRVRGLEFKRQVPIALNYKGLHIERAFRLDLLVEDALPVELKCTDRLSAVYEKQLLTYLRLMNRPIGLLINLGQYRLVDGVTRIVNNYQPEE